MPARNRQPIHFNEDGQPVTATAARTAAPAPIEIPAPARAEESVRSITRDASHQPASGGRFAPTAEPERPEPRKRANASRQRAYLTKQAWQRSVSELTKRARRSARQAQTPEGRRVAGIMAKWLAAQRDEPPPKRKPNRTNRRPADA